MTGYIRHLIYRRFNLFFHRSNAHHNTPSITGCRINNPNLVYTSQSNMDTPTLSLPLVQVCSSTVDLSEVLFGLLRIGLDRLPTSIPVGGAYFTILLRELERIY